MKRTFFVPITVLYLVSACGGSGGSDPVVSADPSLDITAANAELVAKIAYEAALENQQLGNAGNGIIIGSSSGNISKIGGYIVTSSKTDNLSSQVPIPEETIPCAVAGSTTITGDLADPITPTLTPGDFIQVEFSACDDGFDQVTDGILRADIDAFSGDFLTEFFNLTLTMTLTSFQVSTFENQSTTPTDVVTSHGGATLSLDTTNFPFVSTSLSGQSLTVDTNDSSESLTNFTSATTVDGNLFPSPYTTSASGTLDSTQLAGVIRYSNPTMFEGLGVDYPSSGEFLVEGFDSNLLLIAVNNVDVQIEIDLGADGTIDQTINTTWAALTE